MRIYGGKYIIPGLVVFLLFVTFPMWINAIRGGQLAKFESKPNPEGLKCIESKAFMRDSHMQLLVDWRDSVVRENNREYVSKEYGTKHEMSLTDTCMKCHASQDTGPYKAKATYCVDCHDYTGVETYCWDCHVDPGKERK